MTEPTGKILPPLFDPTMVTLTRARSAAVPGAAAPGGEKVSSSAALGEAAVDRQREKAATDFEALLLHQMLQSMWNSVPKDGLVSGSREEELYRDMLTEEVAKSIAENQSLGIRDVVLRDMRSAEKK